MRESWRLILFLIGPILALVLVYTLRNYWITQPAVNETHTVTGFFVSANYGNGTPLIQTKDNRGNSYTARATANVGKDCTVGNRIDVRRQGLSVTPIPKSCRDAELVNDQ